MLKSRWLTLYILIILLLLTSGCNKSSEKVDTLTVAVSIVPEAAFVEAIAGDLVHVVTVIPPGASPTNYQPSPKEMIQLENANVYFSIGVSAEENILLNIDATAKDLMVVDLANPVDTLYPARYFQASHPSDDKDHHHAGRDPHIWMSPKRVIVMVNTIKDVLIQLDPDHRTTYTENTANYIEALETADTFLKTHLPSKKFITMHPSLGYFADDYNLKMISIEKDGKEATALHLQEVIQTSLDNHITVILYQKEFDPAQAKTIANEIGGRVQSFEPLSKDYIHNLYVLNDLLN